MNASIRRVEEASMNAWPALHQLMLDGWLIRLSNGFTKRANCVVPLYQSVVPLYHSVVPLYRSATPPTKTLIEKIRFCENLYAREQLQTVFRLTSHAPETLNGEALDEVLAERGYEKIDETQVQLLDLSTFRSANPPALSAQTELRLVPAPQWLREYARLAEMPGPTSELHANLIRSIRPDCAFALLVVDEQPVACALGVLEHDLFGLFDVITARAHRGKGYAGQLLVALLAWSTQQGAQQAYLQVVANNDPALALYQRLGFEHLYSYWYRRTK